ncbi:MAG: malto-oligosyltrehalose synthase, partial [Thermomicrobiales bacterium]
SEQDRHSRDFTNADLRNVLRETIACFPVYRTYITCSDEGLLDRDRAFIRTAIEAAMRRNRAIDRSVFRYVEQALIQGGERVGPLADELCRFAMKVQQLTGPVMAKGLEDTAFYRFNRLVALNEVGGEPSRFGVSVEEFHRQNRARLRRWPDALLASSTHDTKRSEDVRARIAVLSEMPTEWRAAINRWTRLNRKHKVKLEGALAPHRADEYVIYQTLTGTWPTDALPNDAWETYRERIADYTIKVTREASRFTNWTNPNEEYEAALTGFVRGVLDRRRAAAFIADMDRFQERIGAAGFTNALAQQALKLASPGIPDIYQGTELFDDSLVDPDNRRPVDFGLRADLLAAGFPTSGTPLSDPRWKLGLTRALLDLRRRDPELFALGEYHALATSGSAADHVVAFARTHAGRAVVVAVPRTTLAIANSDGIDWSDTRIVLPPSLRSGSLASWFDGMTVTNDGEPPTLAVGEIFDAYPLAVLTAHEEPEHTGGEGTDV